MGNNITAEQGKIKSHADVRERHFRKKGFMAGFEDIVSGAPKYVEPPFLERAKARLAEKTKGRMREHHIRKRRLIEILDNLDDKPIVKKRR